MTETDRQFVEAVRRAAVETARVLGKHMVHLHPYTWDAYTKAKGWEVVPDDANNLTFEGIGHGTGIRCGTMTRYDLSMSRADAFND